MEDLSLLQDTLNKEYKQKKYEELKTPTGAKSFISGKIGKFTFKLIQSKKYQGVFAIVLLYIFTTGIYHVIKNTFTMITPVIFALCLLVIYWDNIKYIIKKINDSFIKRK